MIWRLYSRTCMGSSHPVVRVTGLVTTKTFLREQGVFRAGKGGRNQATYQARPSQNLRRGDVVAFIRPITPGEIGFAMRVDVFGTNLPLSPSLDVYTRMRLLNAVASRERHVEQITVRFLDINGPRRGNDKVCRIVVVLNAGQTWAIDASDSDPYTAANKAAMMLKRSLKKWLERRVVTRGKHLLRRFVDHATGRRMLPAH